MPMTEIRELLNYAHWETKAADMYAREAVKHKSEYPGLAECYARMAERRLEDADKLCQHVSQLMEKSQHPEADHAVWEWERDKRMDMTRDVRTMLDLYRR